MSRWNSKADRLAAHIRDLSELAGMTVCVHRQGDLLARANAEAQKNRGAGIVIITWMGGANPDRRSGKLRIGSRFNISLWTREVHGDATPADDLIEIIAEHIHGWVDSTPGSLVHRLEVTDVAPGPELPTFIIYEILAEIARV